MDKYLFHGFSKQEIEAVKKYSQKVEEDLCELEILLKNIFLTHRMSLPQLAYWCYVSMFITQLRYLIQRQK